MSGERTKQVEMNEFGHELVNLKLGDAYVGGYYTILSAFAYV